MPLVGLSIHAADDLRAATYPLFEAGEVDIVEYSFDSAWATGEPEWLSELVDWYSSQDRLLGHGVHFSALSGRFDSRQHDWLDNLERECQRRKYVHISEHFGFMTAGAFHRSAPLPVPLTDTSLELGRNRLRRLIERCGVTVGLENLAFAFGELDVSRQGAFLEAMLAEVGGFLVLDLHNLYCQHVNFGGSFERLLDSYPLAWVHEVHVSGGSWSQPQGQPFRRDTHDGAVPAEIFAVLPFVLERCPNVHAVILERLGGTLPATVHDEFRRDYRRLRQSVDSLQAFPGQHSRERPPPQRAARSTLHNEDESLDRFQRALLDLLSSDLSPEQIRKRLVQSPACAPFADYIESFELRCIEVAAQIVRKWGRQTAGAASISSGDGLA